MSDSPRDTAPDDLARLDAELAEVRAALHARTRAVQRLEQVRRRLAWLAARLAERTRREAAERDDVSELEGLGLSALLARAFGSWPAALERERQEWLAARLRRERLEDELAALREDERALAAHVASLGDPRERYRMLLAAKSDRLHARGLAGDARLAHLAERAAALADAVREFDEVVWAGEVARGALTGLLHALSRAQALSAADPLGLLGVWGGAQHLEDAHRHASAANRALSRFRMELRDVSSHHGPQAVLPVDGLDHELYDELLDDWILAPRLDRGHAAVGITRARLQRTLRALLRKRFEFQQELRLVRERERRLAAGG